MEIRSILVHVGLGTQHAALGYAARLAERSGADVIGLAAGEPSMTYVGGGDGQIAIDYYDMEYKTVEARLAAAEEVFRSAMLGSVQVKWRSRVANTTDMLTEMARRCDIVVAASGDATSSAEVLDPGHLIMACGRPVIMASDAAKPFSLDRISVAWKDTREARRAIADALPLLRQADQVKLVTASEGDAGVETGSLNDIAEWLARHGVEVESRLVEPGVELVDALGLAAPSDMPDLVVAGGYGHTRFREWLLGGATRDLLAATRVNRLFSN